MRSATGARAEIEFFASGRILYGFCGDSVGSWLVLRIVSWVFREEGGSDDATFDLVAQAADHAEEHVLRNVLGFWALQLLTVALIVRDEGFEALGMRAEQFLLQGFEFDLAQIGNRSIELARPNLTYWHELLVGQ